MVLGAAGGCRRYVKSRELAPIPPVEDVPSINLIAPGSGDRQLAATEKWLDRVAPKAASAKDADKVAYRLEASRELNNVLPLVAPDTQGMRALELAAGVAGVEHQLGADGALEIAIGLQQQLVVKSKTGPALVVLARMLNAAYRFDDSVKLLEPEVKRLTGQVRARALLVLAEAQRGSGRGKEALATLELYLQENPSTPDIDLVKPLVAELKAAVEANQTLAPVTPPVRGFTVEVTGARATYKNVRHRWSLRYPVDWMIAAQLPDAARFAGSYLGLVVPVSEGPAQAGLIITQMNLAQGDDPWPKLKDGVVRALGSDPGAPKGKSPGKLDLPGETAYFAGETTQQDERLRYEVWILRGAESGYSIVLLSPVSRWFEIRDEIAEALETVQMP